MRARGVRGPRRREVIGGGMAALGSIAAARFTPPSHAAEIESLRRLAAAKGLIYGTTIAAWQITHDPGFIGLVERQAGLVVPENDMKWRDINGGAPGQDDYSRADTVAGFAVESGMALRGHNCLWYFRTPGGFSRFPIATTKERVLTEHLRTLVSRYRGHRPQLGCGQRATRTK